MKKKRVRALIQQEVDQARALVPRNMAHATRSDDGETVYVQASGPGMPVRVLTRADVEEIIFDVQQWQALTPKSRRKSV